MGHIGRLIGRRRPHALMVSAGVTCREVGEHARARTAHAFTLMNGPQRVKPTTCTASDPAPWRARVLAFFYVAVVLVWVSQVTADAAAV